MQDVMDHAESIGLRVAFRDLGRRDGELHSSGLVVLNSRRNVLAQRQVLAHECGHWRLGHNWSREHDRPDDERQANIYAAKVLIAPLDYRFAERIVGTHAGALAKELGVTAGIVALWQQHHQGRGTFLRVVRDAG